MAIALVMKLWNCNSGMNGLQAALRLIKSFAFISSETTLRCERRYACSGRMSIQSKSIKIS